MQYTRQLPKHRCSFIFEKKKSELKGSLRLVGCLNRAAKPFQIPFSGDGCTFYPHAEHLVTQPGQADPVHVSPDCSHAWLSLCSSHCHCLCLPVPSGEESKGNATLSQANDAKSMLLCEITPAITHCLLLFDS